MPIQTITGKEVDLTFGFKGYAYLFFIEFIRPQQMSLAKLKTRQFDWQMSFEGLL